MAIAGEKNSTDPVGQTAGSAVHYRPALDGVRAFCIIFTIFNHIPGSPKWINGNVGVDIFFSLSGWLITWLLLNERSRTGRIDLRSFYIRRIFRILPLYYVVFAFYVFITLAIGLGGAEKKTELHYAALYLATLNAEYRPSSAGNFFGHAWTLGIEEKFYLIWPLLMAVTSKQKWIAVLGGIAVSVLLISLAAHVGLLIRGYFGLGFGAVLALVVSNRPDWRAWLTKLSLGLPLLFLFFAAYLASLTNIYDYRFSMLISALGGLLIVTIWFNEKQFLAWALSIWPLAGLGRLTYALYLVHVLSINLVETVLKHLSLPRFWIVTFVGSYAVAIVASLLLHRLIEKPLIDIGRRLAKQGRKARALGEPNRRLNMPPLKNKRIRAQSRNRHDVDQQTGN